MTDTRTRILEAAARVFAEKGYHETRMDDIVAASAASKGSLYFHFPNKEEIFFGLIETFIGLLETRLRETLSGEQRGMEQLDTALRESLRLFEQYRALAKIVLIQAVGLGAAFEQRRRAINDRFVTLIRERIEKGIQDGSLPPQNAELSARAWVGALNEILIHWIYTGTPDLQTALPEIKAFLARSVGARQ
ncbi:MAG: TetR/AcrR family transcriptional regulator [Anaerolineales bacterium]|nr:TetR/AcrR family transcriptional regulator [Anaerolineales bacterium]MCX7754933.1 TetR/AcrR family transcriptional regulator [Anaerolineales bacterium]MDW8277310.1 TetR/AcrR family transcriptional regulator [Anaerolineales bacterium]